MTDPFAQPPRCGDVSTMYMALGGGPAQCDLRADHAGAHRSELQPGRKDSHVARWDGLRCLSTPEGRPCCYPRGHSNPCQVTPFDGTDEPSTELCGETNGGWSTSPCGLAKDHGGDRHIPDPSKPNAGWWRTAPEPAAPALVCSAVLNLHRDHACTLPEGHSARHKDSDGDEWDITWTRPQSARMEAPAVPLTFGRDQRLRALEGFQDSATSRFDWIQQCAKEAGDRRDEELDDIRTRLEALENGTGRQINIHDFDRIMGRVTATLDTVGTRLIGRGPDRSSEVVAKLNEILTRLGPPEPPRCGIVRPYSGSHGRSGEPNPDDLCVKEKGHTGRHVNGTATWPNPDDLCVSGRCEAKHPESERTHDEGCEREPEHGAECCSHPNGCGSNGCAGCGDYWQD